MDHGDLYFMVQWFCLISQRLFDGWVAYFQIMRQCDPIFDLKISISQHDLYFMVQWFFLTSWRQFWWMNVKLLDNESVWHSHWPWNKCRSEWPIFHDPEILPFITKTIWWMSVIHLDYETVWHNLWPENKYRSGWHRFEVQEFCLISWKTIWWMNIKLLDNESVGHSDIYFLIQWFQLIMLHQSPVMFASFSYAHK